MAKNRKRNYEQNIVIALQKLPNPLEDKNHHLFIYFNNDRARSNETRFEHAANIDHRLTVNDIERIPRLITKSKMRIDKSRRKTYNIYLRRFSYRRNEFIQISVRIEPDNPKAAYLKTIQISYKMK